MNVSLTPELEKLIDDKLSGGMYQTASEVVREALRLLKERDELQKQRLRELQREIRVGLDQLRRGQGLPGDPVFAELRQRSRDRRRRK
ncbi:MAG: type II toxin-antitoxin system ParD family antitoxin [Acidobacteria bacterium]|nr:type II toxin-antitoxin system ParD family antitoxin [Acidobacteriota bacterium]